MFLPGFRVETSNFLVMYNFYLMPFCFAILFCLLMYKLLSHFYLLDNIFDPFWIFSRFGNTCWCSLTLLMIQITFERHFPKVSPSKLSSSMLLFFHCLLTFSVVVVVGCVCTFLRNLRNTHLTRHSICVTFIVLFSSL